MYGIDLTDKVAVVTGGSRGIGAAICIELGKAGARVVVHYNKNRKAALAVAREVMRVGGKDVMVLRADISKPAQAEKLVSQVLTAYGQIDILVNNAGITKDNLVQRMSVKDWDAVHNTNLRGPFIISKAALRAMSRAKRGRIINISSVVGIRGNAGQANYAASKSGLEGLTRALAREYASRTITINAIAPGFIETDITAVLNEKQREAVIAEIPMGRVGQVQEVAYWVVVLAADQASYMTGQLVSVDGGFYMGG